MPFRSNPTGVTSRSRGLIGTSQYYRGVTGAKLGGAFLGFKVFGVAEAIAKLRLAGSIVALELGNATYQAARHTYYKAKELVPVVTGDLHNGIQIHKHGLYHWGVTASSQDGGSDREYASYVEYGTSKMAPRPYLRPAATEANKVLLTRIAALRVKLEAL